MHEHEEVGSRLGGRLRQWREAMDALDNLSPEDKKKLSDAAEQGAVPFIDVITELFKNAGPMLEMLMKFLPMILALFAKKPQI